MASIYTQITLGGLVLRLMEANDDVTFDGTATGGTAPTLLDTRLPFSTDTDPGIMSAWLYLTAGPGAGDERLVTAFTTSTKTVTVGANFSATPTTATKYAICRKLRPTQYVRVLQATQRWLTQGGFAYTPIIGRELILGCALQNAAFDLYTTANVPNGWTLDVNSTFTMETTFTRGGRRVLKGITDGNNVGFVRQLVPSPAAYLNGVGTCYAWVYCLTASRLSLQTTDGNNVVTATHTGTGWERLALSPTILVNLTKLQVSIEVTAGSAVTFYVSVVYFPQQPFYSHTYPIDSNQNLVYINGWLSYSGPIQGPQDEASFFAYQIDPHAWEVREDIGDTPTKMYLSMNTPTERILEYRGWQRSPELTLATTTYTVMADLLIKYAKMELTDQHLTGTLQMAERKMLHEELQNDLKMFATYIPPDAKRVLYSV